MIETAFLTAFIFTLGMTVGRNITLYQQARKTVEGIEALLNSPWYGPQVLAARLHADQDCAPDVGPLILSQTVYCRLVHGSVRARHVQ